MKNKDINITTNDIESEIDRCSCPECGFGDELGIDDISCDQKKCRQCGANMMTSLKQQNESILKQVREHDSIEDKFKVLVENVDLKPKAINESTETIEPKSKKLFETIVIKDEVNKSIDYKSRYHCEKCGIVVNASLFEEDANCPKCGDEYAILEDVSFLDSERRFHCPECKSSFNYTKINEDSCVFCKSLMTVFDNPTIKRSKTAISTE